jgi:alcohol dehydrogenase class IV
MHEFLYTANPARVLFDAGRIDALADEVARLGATRALVLSTPGRRALAEDATHRLGAVAAGIFDKAVMHVPI